MDRRLPSCCGSEDGDLVYGVDPAQNGIAAIIEMWVCRTCEVVTVTNVVMMER